MYNFLSKNRVLIVYVPLAVYWLLIFILTSIPGESVPSVGIDDKLQHLLAYCILSILLYLTLTIQDKFLQLKKYSAYYTMIILFFYALIDEIHQLIIPGRQGEVMDVIADVIGGIIGLIIVRLIIVSHREQESIL